METKAFLRSVVAAGALPFALAASLASPVLAEVDLRIDARPLDESIRLHVLVENEGATVAGLSAGDFAVTLDGQPVAGLSLTRPRSLGADVKTSVAIVTGSLSLPDVDSSGYANLIRELHTGDQVAIVKFRYRPNGEYLIVYMSTLPFLELDGGTNSAEAVRFLGISPEYYGHYSWPHTGPSPGMQAIGEFEARSATLPAGPRALIGAIARDSNALGQLIERAIQDDIILFNVAYAGERLDSFLAKRAATWETGGALVVVKDESQDDLAINRIGDWLNDSYRLSIPAASVTDCGLHALELTVRGQSVVQSFARCDSNPDPFWFELANEVEPATTVVSQPVTITGIDSPVPVEVFDGEYSIGCGSDFTSELGYLQPQDIVCVRHQSSDLPNDPRQTILSVGGGWATFESLTRYFQRPPPPPSPANGGGGLAGAIEILLLLAGLLVRALRPARAWVNLLTVAASLGAPAALAASGDLDRSFADYGRLPLTGSAAGAALFVEPLDSGAILVAGGGSQIERCSCYDQPRCLPFTRKSSSFARLLDAAGALDPAVGSAPLRGIEAVSIQPQPDGGIIALGRKTHGTAHYCSTNSSPVVFRLRADGTLEDFWGAAGVLDLPNFTTAESLLLEPDGHIVIAGLRWVGDEQPNPFQLEVLRLRSGGMPDPSFGSNGVFAGPAVRTHYGYGSTGLAGIRIEHADNGAYRVTVQAAGVCKVVGITADGKLDGAFGDAGIASVNAPSGGHMACKVLRSLPGGDLVVGGTVRKHGYVTRLLPDGAPRPDFVIDAEISRSMSEVTSIAVAAGGQLLVAGTGPSGASIVRLDPTGGLDSSFGDAGRTWIDLDSDRASRPTVRELRVLEDGSILAAGGSGGQPFVVRLLGDGGGMSHGVVGFSKWLDEPQESDGRAIVRVRRSGGSDGAVNVRFRTAADLEARNHRDFVPTTGRLRWAAGDTSVKTIVVPVTQDGAGPEGLEAFQVVLDDVRGGAGTGTRVATVNIQPDGSPAGQIEIDTSYMEVSENYAQIGLFRSYYFEGRVCVTLTPKSGSAIAGEDFSPEPILTCWEDQGEDNWMVAEIEIVDDAKKEGNETFVIELSNPTGGAILGPTRSATVTLYDND